MPHGLLDVEPLVLAQQIGGGGPVDVLHDDVVAVALRILAGVEHLDDVRVLEPGGRERLAPEARDEVLVLGEVLGEQLDRHRALEHRVGGQEDRRHAARAEPAVDPVAAGDLGRRAHQPVPGAGAAAVAARRPAGARRAGLGRRRRLRSACVSAGSGLGRGGLGLRRSRSGSVSVVGLGPVSVVVGSSSPLALLGGQLEEAVEALARARRARRGPRSRAARRGSTRRRAASR